MSERDFLKDFGEVKINKVYTNVIGTNKIAYVAKRRVSLQDYDKSYGSNVTIFDDKGITNCHLGKIKCRMKFKTDDELKDILTKYFANSKEETKEEKW